MKRHFSLDFLPKVASFEGTMDLFDEFKCVELGRIVVVSRQGLIGLKRLRGSPIDLSAIAISRRLHERPAASQYGSRGSYRSLEAGCGTDSILPRFEGSPEGSGQRLLRQA